jgi:YjbE family integral membrane protein
LDLSSAAFWAALGSIVLANLLLSGDNAVVIALAARSLPAQQQRKAVVWGSAAAIVMRVILTLIAAEMMRWPYLKIVGGLLLLYIGVSLLTDSEDDAGAGGAHPMQHTLPQAIRTILVADLVMSLDNVVAVAAAARGDKLLLVLGLAISIPLIVFGSTLLLKVMDRFPLIIMLGAALLGWLAGDMLLTDPALPRWFGALPGAAVGVARVGGALLVVGVGRGLRQRAARG